MQNNYLNKIKYDISRNIKSRKIELNYNVFISYSHFDKLIADAICEFLENKQIPCWIASRDAIPGISYSTSIIDAINNCKVMLLVFSSNSNQSQQVEREIERAVSKQIPIIPFRIEDVPLSKSLEYFISAPHWINALTSPIEIHFEYLANSLETLLKKSPNSAMKVKEISDKSTNPSIGTIHINDQLFTPKYHSDFVKIQFSISNFTKEIQKIPHLWLKISSRQQIDRIRLKKAGAMIQEFYMSATIRNSDIDIISDVRAQLILDPNSTDSFCLQLFGSEGYEYILYLCAIFCNLRKGTNKEILSSSFKVEFPIRNIEILEERKKEGK